jgi:hypothetical protein
MAAVDSVGVVLLLACLYMLALVVRRRMLGRHGGVMEMSVRLRHWTFGLARYEADRLLWFRTFSLSPRPRLELSRTDLQVAARRAPHGAEHLHVLHDAVVVTCRSRGADVEIALPDSGVMGLLAWLEGAPARSVR